MQNEIQPVKMMGIMIEEVNPQSNEIYINDGQGNEGWFPVKHPANIKWIKQGKADITLTNNAITYCRNESQGQSKPFNKPSYGGFSRQSTPYQSKPFTQGNNYTPKEECYYEESEILFEGVGFIESQKIVEDLKKQGKWVFYVQRLPRFGDFTEDENKVTHYKYDVAIGIKEKKLGKRPDGPQEGQYL
jgi:hypothetical protein